MFHWLVQINAGQFKNQQGTINKKIPTNRVKFKTLWMSLILKMGA